MRAVDRFRGKPSYFWACVRSLSQHIGYSRNGSIVVPSIEQMSKAFCDLDLNENAIINFGEPTLLAKDLHDYFYTRALILEKYIEPNLMDAEQAKNLFGYHFERLDPSCPIPMNKQKGEKKAESYLTGLVNMIIEENTPGLNVDYDPRELTTFTGNGVPIRTLSRRVDGAFPSTKNPIAIWEIKEYYYTTTFGSRVADGVYETLLDGMELENLRDKEGVEVDHLLIVDARYTWWECGKSYLCRIIDMLHMGFVSEVLFGREIIERLPLIAREWTEKFHASAYTKQNLDRPEG